MASITWDDVVAQAPQLSTTAAGAQTDILAHVNTALVVADFGGESAPKLKLARVYLAAHLATMAGQGAGGAGGPVTEHTVDRVTTRYADPFSGSAAISDLDSTSYGKMYRQLVRTTRRRAPMVL